MSQNLAGINLSFIKRHPRRYRVATMENRDPLAIAFLRDEIDGSEREEREIRERVKGKWGLYVLTSSIVRSSRSVYVGQGDIWKRLLDHRKKKKKEFWEETYVLLKDSNVQFDESQTAFLESQLIKKVNDLQQVQDRYKWKLVNEQQPRPNAGNVPWMKQGPLKQLLEEAVLCFDALGSELFRELYRSENSDSNSSDETRVGNRADNRGRKIDSKPDVTHQKSDIPSKGVDFSAEGHYYKATMTLLSDRTVILLRNSEFSLSLGRVGGDKVKKKRDELIKDKKLVVSGNRLLLQEDIALKSPNEATLLVAGSNRNALIFWETLEESSDRKITLKEYYSRESSIGDSVIFHMVKDKFRASMKIDLKNRCTVLKDSKARKDHGNSADASVISLRDRLVKEKVLRDQGDHLLFCIDHVFDSPNKAAGVVAGYGVNAMNSWRLPDGTPLGVWKSSNGKND